MARQLEKLNGRWIDKNNNYEDFGGHVERDLEKGDKWITQEKGKKIEYTVLEKEVMEDGSVYISSQGKEVQ